MDSDPQVGQFYQLEKYPSQAQVDALDVHMTSQYPIEIGDINQDGSQDLVIQGLENTSINVGRLDTVVYAGSIGQSEPISHKEIDASFKNYFSHLAGYLTNPTQYLALLPVSSVNSVTYLRDSNNVNTIYLFDLINGLCSSPILVDGFTVDSYAAEVPNFCNVDPGISSYEIVTEDFPDYTGLEIGSIDLLALIDKFYAEEEASTNTNLDYVFSILEDQLGVNHSINNEVDVINLGKLIGRLVLDYSENQFIPPPTHVNHWVELVYTPLALGNHHTYISVRTRVGQQFVTAVQPEFKPPLPGFGGWGKMIADFEIDPVTEVEFEDIVKPIVDRQYVGYVDSSQTPAGVIHNVLNSYASDTNSSQIDYVLLVRNSNTYAFNGVTLLGFLRPVAILKAPGSTNLMP